MAGELMKQVDREARPERGNVLSTMTAIVDKHRPGFPDYKYRLLLELAEFSAGICVDMFTPNGSSDNDMPLTDDARANRNKQLQKKLSELFYHLEISVEVDRLVTAKTQDDFNGALAGVPLDELHGPKNKISRLPLMCAISARDHPLERVQSMFAAGARPDLKTTAGDTVLHEFAALNRKAKIRGAILKF